MESKRNCFQGSWLSANRAGKTKNLKLRLNSTSFAFVSIVWLVLLFLISSPVVCFAAGGSYKINFSAARPNSYGNFLPGDLPCTVTSVGVDQDPLDPPKGEGVDDATFGNPKDAVESLSPADLALGQVVAFEVEVTVDGSVSPENGVIQFTAGFGTKTTSGYDFGFDDTHGIYCAFVDTSDGAANLSGDEKINNVAYSVTSDEIRGIFTLEGLAIGEKVIVEIWMVLDDSIPSGANGRVQSRLIEAQTVTTIPETISTGNQTIPLGPVQQFFSSAADVGVQKMDSPDPVEQLGQLTYTLEVSNFSGDTVANIVQLSDQLDVSTAFNSLTITDNQGFGTTCSHDGSPAGGTLTCDLGFLNPLETVTISVTVDVLISAPTGTGGTGPCVGGEPLCNSVQVTTLNDPDTSNNSASQPTGVTLPGPVAGLALNKVPNADMVYSGTLVTYSYEITNGGTDAVINVGLTDNKCASVSYVSGDTDNDSQLDPGEVWIYTCGQVLNTTTTNEGTATGEDLVTGLPLESKNSATVKVINPGISIGKQADQLLVPVGGTVTYTYTVTNTGDDPLDAVVVEDDKCTPAAYQSGDTNLDNALDLSEVWIFTCSVALNVDTTNTAVAKGDDSLTNTNESAPAQVTVTVDFCPNDPNKIVPGICGCGVADTDSDNDGTADCNDGCPNDPNKVVPGVCGCGVADTDSDSDGTADCHDLCPNDPNKVAPGACGCGVLDTDSDNDGTADCNDLCPNDPNKTVPGICGCGTADTDSDNDGTADCLDNCLNDPNKTEPGICGCGTADTDSDNDGTADCQDNCPNDLNKTEPGICGCGTADTDSDNDGTADCLDNCPNDPNKTEPGICGCGTADTDSDNDGTADCLDNCLNDPNKTEPGICGCGTADTDSDNDGTADCLDNCPNDPNKTEPGICGCGTADTDSDNDGTADCQDNCPNDPNKTEPGICGCGTADTDSDNDGTADCLDNCPSDPDKTEPGICGCGTADTDSDNDGTADCLDNCPNDPNKTEPGICGCGTADTDSDNDGTADCLDNCPNDPNKTEPGICGCGTADTDSDNDGTADCLDNCPNDPNKTEPGICGCGTADTDSDNDGTADCLDNCPNDPNKTEPGICGCGTADTDSDNDGTADCQDNCPNDPNKTEPGTCGCGTADTDSDNDGMADCIDLCPDDPNKTEPGICGCGTADTDSDNDGTADCLDECVDDPNKTIPGICGCGVADTDSDQDGTADCLDECVDDPDKVVPGVCGCGVPDVDTDGDDTLDCLDQCVDDPAKTEPGICGCGVSDADKDQDGTPDCNDACVDDPNKTDPGVCGCGLTEDECLDCNGIPFGVSTFDACGECGGQGCGCLCTETNISKNWNEVRKSARVVRNRARKFAKNAKKCGDDSYRRRVKTAQRLYTKLISTLNGDFEKNILVCEDGVGTQESSNESVKKLRKLTERLHKVSKSIKLGAIKACKTPHDPDATHKTSDDYRDDVQDAIDELPLVKSSCGV